MAGIGFELRKIYGKKTLVSNICATFYATMTTIGPSILFALLVLTLKAFIDVSDVTENERRFFMSSFSYVFLIAILVSALLNTVVSRYVSDCIFQKKENNIAASVFGVLTVGTVITGILMLALCIGMMVKSGIELPFLVLYYFLGILATNTYNLIIYVSALKEYKKITLSYLVSMLFAIVTFLFFYRTADIHIIVSIYLALTFGFFLLNLFLIFHCIYAFGWPNDLYFEFIAYFKRFPKLTLSGFCYMLGFYISTIIFWWFSDIRQAISIFRTTPEYDLAMFLAIVVNMPALVIFVVKTETTFFDKYVSYLSKINHGSYDLIEKERNSMCNIIRYQLFFVYEVQLIITVVLVFIINIFFPYLNISMYALNMFLILSMGLYCVFCMYFTVIFLYYFEDHIGACVGPCLFLAVTTVLALIVVLSGSQYYTLPILVGGIAGWIGAFMCLKYRLKNLNAYLLCK